ncbi:MAG: hypothetical protein EOO65_03630 [Methanosarcinales archaeon]|nr:MAG: hypothetical protein EOO65_03630 [Methanosarcinales archaeon]
MSQVYESPNKLNDACNTLPYSVMFSGPERPVLVVVEPHRGLLDVEQFVDLQADGAREAALPPGWQLFQAGTVHEDAM